jgi:glutathione S-transferase
MACSLASRFALIESGLPHEVAVLHTTRGEQKTEAYLRINPRGKIPALETDEGVITESTAILPYIADLVPEKQLFPAVGTFARAQGQSWLGFLSSTLHVAFSAVMHPLDGCDNEISGQASLTKLSAAYQDVEAHLEGRDHLLDSFSVCDLYLLVFALWRMAPAVSGKLPSLPNLDRFQQTHMTRPNYASILGGEMKLLMAG